MTIAQLHALHHFVFTYETYLDCTTGNYGGVDPASNFGARLIRHWFSLTESALRDCERLGVGRQCVELRDELTSR